MDMVLRKCSSTGYTVSSSFPAQQGEENENKQGKFRFNNLAVLRELFTNNRKPNQWDPNRSPGSMEEAQQDGYGGASMISVQEPVITEITTYLLSRQHKHLPSSQTRSIWESPARWITWVRSWEWSIFSLCHPKTQENQNTGDDSSGRKNRTPWFIASSTSWDCKSCSLIWEMSGPCFLTAECEAEVHSESNTSPCLGAAFIPTGSQRNVGFSSETALTAPLDFHGI